MWGKGKTLNPNGIRSNRCHAPMIENRTECERTHREPWDTRYRAVEDRMDVAGSMQTPSKATLPYSALFANGMRGMPQSKHTHTHTYLASVVCSLLGLRVKALGTPAVVAEPKAIAGWGNDPVHIGGGSESE